MALGGNLKKKSLLPNDGGKDQEIEIKKPSDAQLKETKKTGDSAKPAAKKKESKKSTAKKATAEKAVPKKSVPKKEAVKKAPEKKMEEVKVAPPVEVVKEEEPVSEIFKEPIAAVSILQEESFVIERPVVRQGLVSKIEFERRQKLHEKFSAQIKALDGKQVHLIVFRIENENFAIEISKVNEVVVTPEITRMPQAPKYIPGIATIRGKGIVTLDLGYKLGYVDSAENLKSRSEYTIVIKTEKFTVGVLVPEVPVSHMISGSNIQPAHDNVSETSLDETYVKGLFRTEEGMVFFIDIDEMIEGDRLKARLAE